jgi:hypothetical protein
VTKPTELPPGPEYPETRTDSRSPKVNEADRNVLGRCAEDEVGGYEHLFAAGLHNGLIECHVFALRRLERRAIGPENEVGCAVEANAIEGGLAAQWYEARDGMLDWIDVALQKPVIGERLLPGVVKAFGKIGKKFEASRAKRVEIVIHRL